MLNQALKDFIALNKDRIGIVSLDIPLLSNLDVWRNIALIRQYHRNMGEDDAYRLAMQYLNRLSLDRLALSRNHQLTHVELFCVKLIRAVMVYDAIVVIDRPFKIMPELYDAAFIYNTLKKVEDSYKETHIFDYQRNAQRYNTNDAEED